MVMENIYHKRLFTGIGVSIFAAEIHFSGNSRERVLIEIRWKFNNLHFVDTLYRRHHFPFSSSPKVPRFSKILFSLESSAHYSLKCHRPLIVCSCSWHSYRSWEWTSVMVVMESEGVTKHPKLITSTAVAIYYYTVVQTKRRRIRKQNDDLEDTECIFIKMRSKYYFTGFNTREINFSYNLVRKIDRPMTQHKGK